MVCLTLPGLFTAVGGVAVAVRVPHRVGAGGVAFWKHSLSTLGQIHAIPNALQRSPLRGSKGDEVHWGATAWKHQDDSERKEARGQAEFTNTPHGKQLQSLQNMKSNRGDDERSCSLYLVSMSAALSIESLPTANTVLPRNKQPVTLGELKETVQ